MNKVAGSDYDYPARKRVNEAQPTVGFRCPDPQTKNNLRKVAQARGLSVNQYLQSIVIPQVQRDVSALVDSD